MASNPITETELEAYCRRRHIVKSVWEGIAVRLDDAVLAIWARGGQGRDSRSRSQHRRPTGRSRSPTSIRERMVG